MSKFPRPQVTKIRGFAVEFAEHMWTEAVNGIRSFGFKNIRIRVDNSDPRPLDYNSARAHVRNILL